MIILIGELSHKYSKEIVNCFLVAFKDENDTIRQSSISNLAQFCATLKHSLSYFIVEIISAVESVLKTDTSIDVKRACIMFVHIFLNGINRDNLPVSFISRSSQENTILITMYYYFSKSWINLR